ncbi:hypothetical protein MMC18_009448 [Xylographa bjoerkii]|nr:hypothetical protein [Xylographa bjoerkii]MCJ1396538.1 hypothetical protein [Xylographa bjoerkii]MCJ1396557.1 hypothetical protein [Xylographa bjoerkii]
MIHDGYLEVEEGELFWELRTASLVGSRATARPILLFIHAGVADRTLWDYQVDYFTSQGWDVLRYDRLGYGKSRPKQAYLQRSPRPKLKHYQHAAEVMRHAQTHRPAPRGRDHEKVVVIGLSMGAATSSDFAIAFPDLVCGLVVIAGGLSGFDHPNTSTEEEIFSREAALVESRDAEGLADLRVHLWGDGPLGPEGRLRKEARQQLYTWCKDIAVRELNGTGGSAIEDQDLDPPAVGRLSEIKIPVAVAIGTLDESNTISAMRYVSDHTEDSTLKEFQAGHMVNLEYPDDFNVWLEEWLNAHFR